MTKDQFIDLYTKIINNNETPYVCVDASDGEVIYPQDCIDDDDTLHVCLSPKAVRDLKVKHDTVYCRATFQKRVYCISFPLANILEMSVA